MTKLLTLPIWKIHDLLVSETISCFTQTLNYVHFNDHNLLSRCFVAWNYISKWKCFLIYNKSISTSGELCFKKDHLTASNYGQYQATMDASSYGWKTIYWTNYFQWCVKIECSKT